MSEKTPLYHEYRLIERPDSDINGVWKGVQLLLFCLAFVFGSFCTFCFHMLMYMFDEKCVLFPKLLSLRSMRHNIIYEFMPEDADKAEERSLPVDFVSTQWVDQSACYMPTYVPLISSIFGLVWTTMFLMCSTGSRSLTGLQRPWRVIPPVFAFSLIMGILCTYASTITHSGLRELCAKLGEITGSSTCTYTINVATLAYERRIRGVYQATQLTIMSAWLHTSCWLMSAALALVRMLLAVDFQLIKVRVDLIGSTDVLLDRFERQLRTVSAVTLDDVSSDRPLQIEDKKQQPPSSLQDQGSNNSPQRDNLIFPQRNHIDSTELKTTEEIFKMIPERTSSLKAPTVGVKTSPTRSVKLAIEENRIHSGDLSIANEATKSSLKVESHQSVNPSDDTPEVKIKNEQTQAQDKEKND